MSLENLQDVTLAILAGGQGSRMGRPKGELLIGGEPMLAYLLERVDWPGPTMLVTAPGREHPPGWERFAAEVTDAQPLGPLGGILTALESARTQQVVVLTVDMPRIEQSHVRWLVQEFAQPLSLDRYSQGGLALGLTQQRQLPDDANCANPHPNPPPEYRGKEKRGESSEFELPPLLGLMTTHLAEARELVEPFPSVYRREAIDIIRQRLESGRRSVVSLTEENQFIAIAAPKDWPEDIWTNLNSPADLAAFLNE
jgi:molybdopterin-guanine dinucleotide biosynthesis protein A